MHLLALLIVSAKAWFPVGLSPVDIGTSATSAQDCATCHSDAYADWRTSRHGLAFTNAIFQREYQDKPSDWCVHCHAPLPEQLADVRQGGTSLAEEGVTCVACHVREGRIQARTRAPSSPHDTLVDASFGGPDYCAGCHQFNFPVMARDEGSRGHARVLGYTSEPMQDTRRQHARGLHAQRECLSCHRSGKSGHAYPGGHDDDFVHRAVVMGACKEGAAVRVTLTNAGAGHNVPTGDVHRHLVLRVWPAEAPELLQEATLGRRFKLDPRGQKRLASDTTLPAGQTRTFNFRWRPEQRRHLRAELRLVYTIDEFPLRGRELDERTWVVMAQSEYDWAQLLPCTDRS